MLSEPVKTDVYLKEKSSRLARHPFNFTVLSVFTVAMYSLLNKKKCSKFLVLQPDAQKSPFNYQIHCGPLDVM